MYWWRFAVSKYLAAVLETENVDLRDETFQRQGRRPWNIHVLAIAPIFLYFYARSPKGWNKKAIRALNVKAEPITKLNGELKDQIGPHPTSPNLTDLRIGIPRRSANMRLL